MYYTIDAVQSTGILTIDTLYTATALDAFAVWEDIVTDGHDGYEIDLGERGWLGLMAGDKVRLIEWSDDPDAGGEGKLKAIETISMDATKRRTH